MQYLKRFLNDIYFYISVMLKSIYMLNILAIKIEL